MRGDSLSGLNQYRSDRRDNQYREKSTRTSHAVF
jgi:hypothetical protein